MLQESIHKDIFDYEEKIIGGLSFRKLISAIGAIGLGVGVSALLTICWQVNAQISAYIGCVLTIPIWFLGFVKPHDMPPEQYLPLWFDDQFKGQILTYQTINADKLAKNTKKVSDDVTSDKEAIKKEKHFNEWQHIPETRKSIRLDRKLWKRERSICLAKEIEANPKRA